MTVEKLIEKLQKVKDKKKRISFFNYEMECSGEIGAVQEFDKEIVLNYSEYCKNKIQ